MAYHNILIEMSSSVVLTTSLHGEAIARLAEMIPDSKAQYDVGHPNHMDTFPLEGLAADEYPKWSWDYRTRLLSPTSEHIVTKEVKELAVLASAKRDILVGVMLDLTRRRISATTGVCLQELVYTEKRKQARDFKQAGSDPDSGNSYPYVAQYADIAGTSLEQAADDILFAASLSDEILVRTEGIRIKYFNKIKFTNDPDRVRAIWKEYYEEVILDPLK